jgi:hypothetical protein
VGRFMSLYPDSGRVISASGGRITTTRARWSRGSNRSTEYVGRNMQDPKWDWGTPQVDVLSPDAAVVTTTYRIPHRTPAGEPHTVAGAWTAVFARRNGKWVIVPGTPVRRTGAGTGGGHERRAATGAHASTVETCPPNVAA